jgi:hypothetical protein
MIETEDMSQQCFEMQGTQKKTNESYFKEKDNHRFQKKNNFTAPPPQSVLDHLQ